MSEFRKNFKKKEKKTEAAKVRFQRERGRHFLNMHLINKGGWMNTSLLSSKNLSHSKRREEAEIQMAVPQSGFGVIRHHLGHSFCIPC